MKRNLFIGLCVAVLCTAIPGAGKERKGPMAGTWDCQAEGGSQGNISFTLFLTQNKEMVDGTISSPMGGTQISSGTFHKKMLEIHLDTPQGNYILMGKYEKGTLAGNWSSDTEKGTWTGKKKAVTGQ